MRQILFAVCLFAFVLAIEADAAPPGRGGGGGGFGGPSGGFGPPSRSLGNSSSANFPSSQGAFGSPIQSQSGDAFEQRTLNEDRILNHRLDQAEQLRQQSASNGNVRLGETADRMEQNAQQHYEDHSQQINQLQNRSSARNGPPYMQQNPAVGQPWAARPSPPAVARKPSLLDRMKRLWPFK
jgi:hypothetical protein